MTVWTVDDAKVIRTPERFVCSLHPGEGVCVHRISVLKLLLEEAKTAAPSDPTAAPTSELQPPPTPVSGAGDLTTLPWFDGFRPHQETAINETVQHFIDGIPLVILDAPTGSGKTVIAEAVRETLRQPGLYVATTKTLQDQVLRDFPWARVLKGRANYPTQAFPERFESTWKLSCADCTKEQYAPESCKWCRHTSVCPYEKAKHQALSAKLAVLNTAYFLTEANMVGKFSGNHIVIADEADTLEEQLMGYVSVGIPEKRLKALGIGRPGKITVEASWVEWLENEALPAVKTVINQHPWTSDDLRDIREGVYLDNLQARLKALAKGLGDGWWIYDPRQDGTVEFKPVRVNHIGKDYLWAHSERWLLMSATVISPQHLVDDLGYEGEYRVVRVPHTFPIENRRVHIRPVANMTNKTKDSEWPKMGLAVRELVNAHDDVRILIHTVSYQLSKWIDEWLEPVARNGRPVLRYSEAGERERILRKFRETPRGVLIASSMGRGVDLPGDECRVQIICKVPFPNLGDRQVQKRVYGSSGGRAWYGVKTVRELVQACGRSVRGPEDWAVTYILDRQFMEMVWRQNRSLLPRWFTDALVMESR